MPIILVILTGIGIALGTVFICQLFQRNHKREDFIRLETLLSTIGQSQQQLQQTLLNSLNDNNLHLQKSLAGFKEELMQTLKQHWQGFDQHQLQSLKLLQESMQQGMGDVRTQITATLNQHTQTLNQRFSQLLQDTDQRLKEISGQVDKRLAEGFEKTTATFADVIKRLALIDEAQKKITELSSNVVSLQEILADKRSRGAFGEVQLNALIRNTLPETQFALQHTLKNGKRVDCILFLPEPTGNVAIDAKFPLENYRRLSDTTLLESERRQAEQLFRQDIRKHVQDIASKYIVPGETSDGAIMFIPAEAIFAEIHANYYDVIELAQKAHIWLVSPTTLMAILTTARAVLKDAATREQIHIIQEHLSYLSKDFDRFQKRMDNLARHIEQAHTDVKEVKTSADKISKRFDRIEQVELNHHKVANLHVVGEENG